MQPYRLNYWRAEASRFYEYFYFKKELLKAKEFYTKLLRLENLQPEVYNRAKSKLATLKNEN